VRREKSERNLLSALAPGFSTTVRFFDVALLRDRISEPYSGIKFGAGGLKKIRKTA